MPKTALVLLGVTIGVIVMTPAIGIAAVVGADLLFDRHQRRAGRG